MRKRARLRCGTVQFHFLSHMIRSCWLRALESKGKAELKMVSEAKWPTGLHMRQEAGVCVYKIGLFWPPHNQQAPAASCLPSCTAIRLFVFISYRPGCYWTDGGVNDYLPMDSLFLWFNPLLRLYLLSLCRIGAVYCQQKDDKTKYKLVSSRAM